MKSLIPLLIVACAFGTSYASAEDLHPEKFTVKNAANPIFDRPTATKLEKYGVTKVVLGSSQDKKFTAAIVRAGKFDADRVETFNQFVYVITGEYTLTSADGTVTHVKAGDAVWVPKGWKGHVVSTAGDMAYIIYDDSE